MGWMMPGRVKRLKKEMLQYFTIFLWSAQNVRPWADLPRNFRLLGCLLSRFSSAVLSCDVKTEDVSFLAKIKYKTWAWAWLQTSCCVLISYQKAVHSEHLLSRNLPSSRHIGKLSTLCPRNPKEFLYYWSWWASLFRDINKPIITIWKFTGGSTTCICWCGSSESV